MSVTLTLSDAAANELRAALAASSSSPGQHPMPDPAPQPAPPPIPAPTDGRVYDLVIPDTGNLDRYVGMSPGEVVTGRFTMPVAAQLNVGFQRVANANILRTFSLYTSGIERARVQDKSAMFTLGSWPGMIPVLPGSEVWLRVENAINGVPTGMPGACDGFFQIQRPG